jgi:hypothetical protein
MDNENLEVPSETPLGEQLDDNPIPEDLEPSDDELRELEEIDLDGLDSLADDISVSTDDDL